MIRFKKKTEQGETTGFRLGFIALCLMWSSLVWAGSESPVSVEASDAYRNLLQYSPKNLNLRQLMETGALLSTRAAFESALLQSQSSLMSEYEVTVQTGIIKGVPIVEVIPSRIRTPGKVIIYVHGGAFVFLSARSGLSTSGPLASELGVRIIGVDYTLAPEKKLPSIRVEIRNVIQGLLDQGIRMKDIGYLADSAGAPLVMGAVQEFLETRSQESGSFWAMALYSPWSDLRLIDESLTRNAEVDPLLRVKDYLEVAALLAVESPSQVANPINSVNLLRFHERFPPTLIQVGDREILLDQALKLHAAMQTQNRYSEYQVFEGMWHVFQSTHPGLKESREARVRVREFFEKNTSQAQ